jgi:hypothetical protein
MAVDSSVYLVDLAILFTINIWECQFRGNLWQRNSIDEMQRTVSGVIRIRHRFG